MAESRRQLFLRILDMLQASGASTVDPRDGWPGIADVQTPRGKVRVALHVGPIGLSHRNRDEVERRFQNPGKGKPIDAPEGALPLLVGLWQQEGRPVLVGMDAEHRLGRETRQSLFIPLWLLYQSLAQGWSQSLSTSDELIIGFHPFLLPSYLELKQLKASPSPDQIAQIIRAGGLGEDEELEPEERTRQVVSSLVRNAAFGHAVVEAYGGLCAMCGLNLGLVQGAHIYPVAAPKSPDKTWNGLALCGNHHAAFDRHQIWVEPESFRARLHPELLSQTSRSPASLAFVQSTQKQLTLPKLAHLTPKPEMFAKRYLHFEQQYSWVESLGPLP